MTDMGALHSVNKTGERVSVVIPMMDEAGNLPEMMRRLEALLEKTRAENPSLQWEVIVVNDGSRDKTGKLLEQYCTQYAWLSVLHFSRNFGHQIAITAGMDYATGDAVIVMDGDLQDPPELIPELLATWRQGFDVVYATRRVRKGESPFKIWTAKCFYRVLQKLTPYPIPLDTGDFRLMSKRVVQALSTLREQHRFVRGLVSWAGYRQTAVLYDRDARYDGETKYQFWKMMTFALNGIRSFSNLPLQWIIVLGYTISAISFLGLVWIVIGALTGWVPMVHGWASIMVTVLFLGGIQLISIGMIAEYLGMVFDEVRKRPLYLIEHVNGPLEPIVFERRI